MSGCPTWSPESRTEGRLESAASLCSKGSAVEVPGPGVFLVCSPVVAGSQASLQLLVAKAITNPAPAATLQGEAKQMPPSSAPWALERSKKLMLSDALQVPSATAQCQTGRSGWAA